MHGLFYETMGPFHELSGQTKGGHSLYLPSLHASYYLNSNMLLLNETDLKLVITLEDDKEIQERVKTMPETLAMSVAACLLHLPGLASVCGGPLLDSSC